jgi:hypothetical protein
MPHSSECAESARRLGASLGLGRTQSEALGPGFDDVGIGREPVDDGGDKAGITDHLTPFGEREIRGCGHRGLLLALGQNLEQQLSPFGVEVGYIPFEAEAANLFFQLASARYERASVIVTSNKPFGRWGEVFGDAVVAAAMIDRLVHHAEVVSMKGDSYRLKDRDLGRVPTDDAA